MHSRTAAMFGLINTCGNPCWPLAQVGQAGPPSNNGRTPNKATPITNLWFAQLPDEKSELLNHLSSMRLIDVCITATLGQGVVSIQTEFTFTGNNVGKAK